MPRPPWWEKTVEYLYVCETSECFDFAQPLAGNQERDAGDAIFGRKDRLILIEFKRDAAALTSEEEKYIKPFAEVREELAARSGHHFFVFGERSAKEGFKAKARPYFGNENVEVGKLLDHGETPANFKLYIEDLASFRSGDDSGSGTDQTFAGFLTVFGIRNGKFFVTMSLQDYIHEQKLRPSSVSKVAYTEPSKPGGRGTVPGFSGSGIR